MDHKKVLETLIEWLEEQTDDDTAIDHPNSYYAGIIEGFRETQTKIEEIIEDLA